MEKDKVKQLIEDLRPYLNIDGGDIEFIDYKDDIVYVKLTGNCVNCLMQDNTLNDNILSMLKQEMPTIKDIINVEL